MGPLRALTAERPPGVTPRGWGEVRAMGGSACSAPLGTGLQNPWVVPRGWEASGLGGGGEQGMDTSQTGRAGTRGWAERSPRS